MKPYLLLFCLILSACSDLPPAISDAPVFDISYTQANQAISQYQNASVRWGGLIIEVENEQNASFVQILSYPLTSGGRPRLDQASEGRFLIKSTEFLDPAIYTKDTLITVAGSLNGAVERTIGKKVMRMPLISAKVIYLWPVYQYNNYYGYGGYGGYGYGYGGFGTGGFGYPYYGYNPYYWGGYYSPLYYRY